jgi:hypothetical protein
MLRKFATLQVLEAFRAPEGVSEATMRREAHRVGFTYEPRPGFLYVRSRAISSRCNDNFDEFPAAEIKAAYRTFIGKPVFVNHHNDDHRRARGVIIDAALHEDRNPDGTPDTWAEVLMEVDGRKFPKLAKAIMAGEVDRTSMGCDVARSVCSACNNVATNPAEYCQHIPALKGQRIFRINAATGRREGELIREKCYGLSFFENSLLVEPPADPTAYFLGVDDRGMKTEATRKIASASADDDNLYHLGGTHHAACGRYFPGRKQAVNIIEERLHHPGDSAFDPVSDMVHGARSYNRSVGLADPHAEPYADVRTHPDRIRALAHAYDAMKENDPAAHAAFHEMRRQVGHQYDHLTNKMGVHVESVEHDPYKDVHEMVHDLRQNKRLKVLSTAATGPHGFFSDEDNDKFRAVHDAFGHAATGRSFDRHGEEAAWLAHSQMFHGKAKHAMTSETRGQNSMLIATGNFPAQKTALLPSKFLAREALKKGAPFADYTDFEDCTDKNSDKNDPDAYCGEIKHRTEDKKESSARFEYAPDLDPYELDPREAAGPRYPNPADHPFFQEHPSHPDNIVAAWHQADEGKKAQGKRWYSDAHHIATAIAGGDAAKGAGVLAAYSPKAAWPSNMFNAARSLKEGRALGKGEGDSIMGMHQNLAHKMIGDAENPPQHHSKVLKSPKISDFAHLIEHGGDEDPDKHTRVVVDRHAMSIATGHRMTTKDLEDAPLGSRHYYEHVADHYRQAAATISNDEGHRVHPHQVQAVTWLVQQHKNMAHDLEHGGPGGKGRQTRDKNMWNRWQEKGPEHVPSHNPGNIHMVSPHAEHAASRGADPKGLGPKAANHPIGVDDADSGRKMITTPKGYGNMTREDGEWYVENEDGEQVGRHKQFRPGLRMLTDHYGLDEPLDVEHTDRFGRTTKNYTLPGRNKKKAFNEIKAPPEVDTLRDEECPVCGEAEVYDGERCPVCGFVAPPAMFRDPNLEVAQQVDLRPGTNPDVAPGQMDPNAPGGGLISPDQLGEDPLQEQLQHPDQLGPNGEMISGIPGQPGTPGDGVPDLFCPACGYGMDAGQPMSATTETAEDPSMPSADGPEEGQVCPNCGHATMLTQSDMSQLDQMGEMAAPGPQDENMGEGDEDTDPEENGPQGPPQGDAEAPQQDDEEPDEEDEKADDAVDDDDPTSKRRGNSKGAKHMNKAVEAAVVAHQSVIDRLVNKIAAQDTKLDVLAKQNAMLAKLAGVDAQFAAIQREADVNNPASPVPDPPAQPAPESTEEAVTPETMDDPQNPGETPGSVQHVPAEQVTTPLEPGMTMPTPPANNLIDVTAPVAGTQTGEVPLEQRRIETDVRVGDPMANAGSDQAKMFPWTMGAANSNRTMASMRLAKLRVSAGLAQGDEFAVAASIEADKELPDVALAHEIRTLEAMSKAASKQQRPAGLVPRAASASRTAPSMAASAPAMVSGSGGGFDDMDAQDLYL